MTQTIAATVGKARTRAPSTMAGALAAALLAVAAESEAITWPSPIYADRPQVYAREVLGADMLPEQERILAALAKPNARVSVASGHKCGKDFIGSAAAWWFFDSFEGARVQLTAPTSRQVDGITWREVKLRMRGALVPVARPDEVGELARTGVVAADLREIKGFTAKTSEAVAGISGPHVLYIVTEASGVEDPIFEAIEGNLAGSDARILLITNPTRRRGYFWDSHHKNAAQWSTFQLSSWDIARAMKASGRTIPGLATERWCQERLDAWGKTTRGTRSASSANSSTSAKTRSFRRSCCSRPKHGGRVLPRSTPMFCTSAWIPPAAAATRPPVHRAAATRCFRSSAGARRTPIAMPL